MRQTLEGNKLIAEFMGGKNDKKNYLPKNVRFDVPINGTYSFPIEKLMYHQSYDWLIPVVKKINIICNEKGSELSNKSREQEHLADPLDNPKHWKSWSYHYVHVCTDINKVYKDVIEFIEWYNGCSPILNQRERKNK